MDIQISQILFQILNFSVVLYVLNKFLYKPILNILDQRKNKIESGMAAAEENLHAQEELETTKKQILSKAQAQASKIVADAKKAALKESAVVLDKAKVSASKVLAKDRKALENSVEIERKELEKQFSKLVVQTTEQLLKKYLNPAEQKKIISSQLKDLKKISLN
jgi:F-type H+-transporting ATPase subunit b